MPKGHKRKNAGVGVDFKRAKHKVGKKLPQAQNATDTTVVSRAIALPEQSIAVDKSGAVVTHRNLTLKDLLGQCGHYSEKVRLDAINGLAELLLKNPNEARRHAATVIAAVSERTADADPGCRAAQRDLVQKSLLPALGKEALQPFIPVVMGHICAAMTHLAEPIRADSLKLLEIIMHWRADLVVAGYLTQVLQHFGDALARPTRGRSLKAGSLAALISIVSGLYSFLTKALPFINQTTGMNTTESINGGNGSANNEKVAAGVLPLEHHNQEAPRVLCWQRCTWPPAPGSIDAVNSDVITTIIHSNTNSTSTSSSTAARVVLDLLLDCWMECSPGELSSHPEAAPARAATTILQCCNILLTGWGTSLAGPLTGKSQALLGGGGGSGSGTTSSAAVAILEKVAVHFPILEPAIALHLPLRDQLVQLNVSAAQLLVLFLSEVITATANATAVAAVGARDIINSKQPQQQKQQIQEPLWSSRLLDWLQGVMASGIALPAADDDPVGGSGRGDPAAAGACAGVGEMKQSHKKKKNKKKNNNNLENTTTTTTAKTTTTPTTTAAAVPAAVYGAALSAVEDILPLLPPQRRRDMLAAAWSLWTRTQVKSSARAKTLTFFSRLLSTPASTLYTPLPPTGEPLVVQEEAAAWVAAMPRFLWELGTAAPATSVSALGFLLDAARYSLASSSSSSEEERSLEQQKSPLQNVLGGLHPQLTPLFGILMPPSQNKNNINKSSGDGGSAKGKTTTKNQQQGSLFVPGPLASLPESTQWLAVDVLYHLPGLPESTLTTIALVALGGGNFPSSTALRLIDVALFKASEADSAQFWGILLALVSGTSRSGVEKGSLGQDEGWKRHEVVVEAGCRAAVAAAGGTQAAWEALAPALLDICKEKDAGNREEEYSSVGVAKVLHGLLALCSATFIKKNEEKVLSSSSAAAAVTAALPGVFLDYVRVCIECAAEDPVVHVARPQAAAAVAVKVLAAEPAVLLGATLLATAASVSSSSSTSTTKSAIEAALLLLLEIAANDTLEIELVKCSNEAETAVKAVKTAIEERGDGRHVPLSFHSGLHRLLALMSQKLGIKL